MQELRLVKACAVLKFLCFLPTPAANKFNPFLFTLFTSMGHSVFSHFGEHLAMVSPLFYSHLSLFILASILWILATVEAQRNVSVGDSLSANDKTMAWQSPSGDFAFGFQSIPTKQDRFLLAIWYAKIQERTIVWYANRDNPETDRDSTIELDNSGHLVLKDPKGKELWRSQRLTDGSQVPHAAMLDTGNFVIASKNSTNI